MRGAAQIRRRRRTGRMVADVGETRHIMRAQMAAAASNCGTVRLRRAEWTARLGRVLWAKGVVVGLLRIGYAGFFFVLTHFLDK